MEIATSVTTEENGPFYWTDAMVFFNQTKGNNAESACLDSGGYYGLVWF